MQTILGANGQIAEELAKELNRNYTSEIRLVSRTPRKVNSSDTVLAADLLNAEQTDQAVQGSEIVYLTVGLPMDTARWQNQFPVMMRNVIEACKKHQARLVFFDNTYMYPQNAEPLTEETTFAPVGAKGKVRAEIATMLLDEIKTKQLKAVICRAPEFYGTGKTQSITNTAIFENIQKGKRLKVFLRDNTLRTLIFTPDASKAMALIGNTNDAYDQTWHLPCDDQRLDYRQFINLASEIYGERLSYSIVPKFVFSIGSVFSKQLKELKELLPRYEHNNIFISDKFKQRFPGFSVTSYREGIIQILAEQSKSRKSIQAS